jgi:hypothetical protein
MQQDMEHSDDAASESDPNGALPANSASTSITAAPMRAT